MKPCRVFSQTGWRRAGAINVSATYICGLVLLVCFAISVSRTGSSILVTIIFDGPCATSSKVNLFLHLLVNILSSAVLASSNFFMQILSAPSREEIDRAHAWLESLDIGIPSFKNLRHVSWFKRTSWFIFFISSAPIHLFFNSAIFRTEYLGSEWHLTIATEAFTKGGAYYAPGASLSPAGSSMPAGPSYMPATGYAPEQSYGSWVPLSDYWEASSIARRNITLAAKEAHNWTILSSKDCQAEYISCKARSTYGDVVIIVEPGTSHPDGWTRSEVFNFQPSSNLSSYWDPRVPPDSINSLWFSTQCSTVRSSTGHGTYDTCYNTCLGALGSDLGLDQVASYGSGPPSFSFVSQHAPAPQDPWFLDFFFAIRESIQPKLYQLNGFNIPPLDSSLGFKDEFKSFRVRHCLAKPNPGTCKVGVSNALLLVVIGCVLVKAIQATIVVWKLPAASLVTPGDAIASFLSVPDPRTKGLCTLDIVDCERFEVSLCRTSGRIASSISGLAWVRTYIILISSLILLAAGFVLSSKATDYNYSYSFDHASTVIAAEFALSYYSALLLVNAPQLIFSSCYYVYNAIITRLHVEKEWDSFSSGFRPLRVSYPAGEQTSSYRLQLPYSYSIPMIAISISFHFFISNAVYLLLAEGGQLKLELVESLSILPLFHLSQGSAVALGYSPFFFLVLFIASFVLIICSPVLLGLQKLRYTTNAGGCSSLVISAACHPSDRATDEQTSEEGSSSSRHSLLDGRTSSGDESGPPLKLAQRKLRWGAMTLPRSLAECKNPEGGEEVFHLGFGTIQDGVWDPNEGHYYA
ncbi:hypothetical protein F5Y14DRAFT_439852 [Nemania sp. NC0429]|nr:hypothetical protein F5Y14DRAFT_439852 [Nemania sp. NC0429]